MYDPKTNMVKKGTVAKVSQIGHYNFRYPHKEEECTFLSDAIVIKLPWAPQDGRVAVKIVGSFLEGSNHTGDKRYIVWVKPTDIECY